MSYQEIRRAEDSLDAVLRDVLRLKDDEVERIIEAIKDLSQTIADQEIDRLFNRGDFRG